MKKIYFRILAICLSLILSFTILYKDSIQADALEWVGVAVGYDTAFKFLLGLLGVSVGVGVAQEVDWGTLRQNAIQVQLDQGNSQAEVSAWWSNVIHGSLDIASDCWDSFKLYVSENLVPNTSTGTPSNVLDICKTIIPTLQTSNLETYEYDFALYYYNPNNRYYNFYFFDGGNYYISDGSLYVQPNQLKRANNIRYDATSISFYDKASDSAIRFFANGTSLTYLYNIDVSFPNQYYFVWELGSSPADNTFDSVYPDIGDIALNPENADTLATDVIPLPWENIGASDTDIEGIIDDAISRVIDGTLSLENYWEYVQNITNTYAYSIENNYLLPNENGEDKKADDKVKENTENGAFVLYGLEKVFPFCIPFDIYAFITLLKADPVAPVIEYPIYNPVTQENEIITIDFSEWESVVIIFRYIFDFLLIIGLLLLARPLVGAGGDS